MTIFGIIDKIFDMSSKVLHGVTISKVPFKYHPGQEDAEMLLGVTSLIYYWASTKFEKTIRKKVIRCQALKPIHNVMIDSMIRRERARGIHDPRMP
jgi:hypothetical protein